MDMVGTVAKRIQQWPADRNRTALCVHGDLESASAVANLLSNTVSF